MRIKVKDLEGKLLSLYEETPNVYAVKMQRDDNELFIRAIKEKDITIINEK